jgi:hypothetical protein
MPREGIRLLVSVGLALALGAMSVGIWAAGSVASAETENANLLAPTGSVKQVAAVGDIRDERASSVAARDPNGPQAFAVGTGGRRLDKSKDTAPNSVLATTAPTVFCN